jgi:hypothetical protein
LEDELDFLFREKPYLLGFITISNFAAGAAGAAAATVALFGVDDDEDEPLLLAKNH